MCITQLKAQAPSRTCNESKEEGGRSVGCRARNLQEARGTLQGRGERFDLFCLEGGQVVLEGGQVNRCDTHSKLLCFGGGAGAL